MTIHPLYIFPNAIYLYISPISIIFIYQAGDETINDHIPDINNDDEISVQANTLTAGGSDAVDDGDIPDLPRDSRYAMDFCFFIICYWDFPL